MSIPGLPPLPLREREGPIAQQWEAEECGAANRRREPLAPPLSRSFHWLRLRREKAKRAPPPPRYALRLARVRAALRAAAARPVLPLVFAALRAAAERSALLRRLAALLAWRDSADFEAVLRGSFSSTRLTARATRGWRFGLRSCCPAS